MVWKKLLKKKYILNVMTYNGDLLEQIYIKKVITGFAREQCIYLLHR